VVVEHESDKLVLRIRWVQFDLVHHGLYFRVDKEIRQTLDVEVGDTDTFCETFFDERLHLGPKDVHWHSIGGVFLEKACRPVHQIEVHIFELQLG